MPSAPPSASRRHRLLLLSLAVPLAIAGVAAPAQAQKVVPKLKEMCPLGYVDLFNGKCSTLGVTTYRVTPSDGESCASGWMNVGGGYCRRK
ncbi:MULTISPECIES: hypothetical protein [unclassified Synechococcus]|uniref:hypothetical protein n=1 Tax=unclassified Synechococcus TaxID=2626047 RepID=UPI00030625E8|nr:MULTISPECIES: hypothetical protein [unclassified Synechococcus]WFN58335.1 hypothetical protein N4320_11010 [Synechococcus sp. CCFWC 502]CAK6688831.1 hypothetical protein ICNINCKA_00484 [Synechococcus sp. CBW1107]